MLTSNLKLRALPVVALALFVAPLVGLATVWCVLFVPLLVLRQVTPATAAAFLVGMLVAGCMVCWIAELVFVVPLLAGFHDRGWRWLNGWSGAAFGAALGYVFGLSFALWASEGWRTGLTIAFAPAAVGLVAAVVFRLVAVRTVKSPTRGQQPDRQVTAVGA